MKTKKRISIAQIIDNIMVKLMILEDKRNKKKGEK